MLRGRIADLWNCVNSETVAKFLISHNSNINSIRNYRGDTPLHSAVIGYQANHKIVELLLANSANIRATNKDGKTPLHLVVERTYSDQHDVARRRTMIDVLIAKDAEVNAKDNDGNTPLHLAIPYKYYRGDDVARSTTMIDYLIAKGANINLKNNDGNTVLHLATKKTIAKLLIAKSADVNSLNNMDNSPLNMAINDWNVEYNNPRDEDETDETIELFILNGANVNTTIYQKEYYHDSEGDTPLHRSIKAGKNNLSKLLVSKGANINAKNASGVTPLDIARASGNRQMSVFLRSRGGNDSGLCRVTQIFD